MRFTVKGFLFLFLLLFSGFLGRAWADNCFPWSDTEPGSLSGSLGIFCQVCENSDYTYDFDCTFAYQNYADEPGLVFNGHAQVYVSVYNESLAEFTFSEGPLYVTASDGQYVVYFRDLYFMVNLDNWQAVSASGAIDINGQVVHISDPNIFNLLF